MKKKWKNDVPGFKRGIQKLLLIMKLTALLTLLLTLAVSAGTYSQNTKLDLSLEDVTIEQVLLEIENNSRFIFIYESGTIDKSVKRSISVKGQTIDAVLSKLLEGTEVNYSIDDRQVTLYKRGSLPNTALLPRASSVQAPQPATVSGKVTESTGAPLPGVAVVIKGTTQGTITDTNGNYLISNVPGNAILQFSFVGMKTQEISVSGNSNIDVTLSEEIVGIEEVVAIGYGTMKKSDLTGAIGVVDVEDLPKAATTSVTQMLSGKVAGVQIKADDAQPGGGVTVLIRGAGSTGAGNEPLIIIDGFPVTNDDADPNSTSRYATGSRSPLNSINPNDIESIEVLKDVSASSIYGARAANGVILITTKSGKKGDAVISYDFKQSVQTVYKDWDMMNASEYMTAYNAYGKESWKRDKKIDVYGNTDPSAVTPYTPRYLDADIAQAGEGTNWFKEVTRTGKIQDHNLSISGGNDKTNYLVSFNSFDQEGIVRKSNFNRITGRLNLDHQVRDWIKIGVRATGSRINIDNPAITQSAQSNYTNSESAGISYRGVGRAGIISAAISFLPTYPVRDENGDYSQNLSDLSMANPVSLFEITNITVQDRLFSQSYVEFEPVENLKIRSQLGFDRQEGTASSYLPKTVVYGAIYDGQAGISQVNKFDKLFNTTINYNKAIREGHNLNALLGYEFQEFESKGHSLKSESFSTDAFLYNNIGGGNTERERVESYKYIDKIASYFGRINYNIYDKYLFTLSMRADGSTKFGKGNKFGYFPSGAFAWRIINEEFLKDKDWISNLKLRLSAGQTGNSNISGAFAYYGFGHNYQFGNNQLAGSYLASYANDNLKWETTTEYNLGLDWGFFNNRINGAVELYYKEISDLLGSRQLPTYMVLDRAAANLGVVSSKGYEITLNTINIDRAFKWKTTINVSAYRDRWKERSPDVVLASYQSETDPLRVYWGYELDGLVQPGEIVPHMKGAFPGVQKVKDINGYDEDNNLTGQPDGIINNADIVKIANVDPDFVFGFTNSLEYKNFDLNVHLYGMIGLRSSNPYLGINTNLLNLERWNAPRLLKDNWWSSENQDAKYPNNNVANSFPGADQYILEKADFVRVKNITLGYNLPRTGKLGSYFKNARIYIDVSNPIIITDYTGIDPEYSNGSAQYPSQRTFTFGVSLKF